jgi:carbon-monoxide dehydrogenase large subunit
MPAHDDTLLPHLKFGIGQSVSRKEDPKLITGRGRYTDDVDLPGQVFAHPLRSHTAHGMIRHLDVSQALAEPGVLAVYTAADMASAGYGEMRCKLPLKSVDGSALFAPPRPIMATGRVRYVDEILAMVVAQTRHGAQEAAERIVVEIDPLPVVTDLEAAVQDDAPRLHDEHSNVCLDWRYGDLEATERAFADAAHVTRVKMVNNRVVVAAMEPRAAVAAYDQESGRFTLHVGCQGVFGLRQSIANDLLQIEPERLRVLADDVGGSFGMKSPAYPEYIACLHAARALGRPVRWRDDRAESFLSDQHGRSSIADGELALDAEGNFLAVRLRCIGDMGAYLSNVGPMPSTVSIQKNLPSVYRTRCMTISTRCVFTNTTPTGPYRGAGRPEANYYMERLIDAAARETGRDPAALRRQNMIPRDAMPYAALSGLEYDSGDFAAVQDACLDKADWRGFEERRQASAQRGRLRGRGLACYLEVTGPPGKEMGGILFEPDGRVTVITGTLDYGQGHASAFAQVLSSQLGVPFELIDLIQGDSDQLLVGGGTGGSRSIMGSGKAIIEASAQVVEQGRALAGHFLETAAVDITFEDGSFRVAGTDRAVSLMELVAKTRSAQNLPRDLPNSLDVALISDTPPSSFPNGCHVAEIEIDPQTGVADLQRYTAVDDFGVLVNPMLVDGQVHGGVAQGIGQALMEATLYDRSGQLMSGSFMDYTMPRAETIPPIGIDYHPVPATTNPLGAKGCGEAGVTGALPAVINAVLDALAERGVRQIDMPATPERIWAAMRANAA